MVINHSSVVVLNFVVLMFLIALLTKDIQEFLRYSSIMKASLKCQPSPPLNPLGRPQWVGEKGTADISD